MTKVINTYYITKTVKAESIEQALKLELKTKPDSIEKIEIPTKPRIGYAHNS